ncbi:hypothetical protein HK104_008756 [Borealophlyctis nickersoniae]|nr:hypothetical protein HK104_008756 [Borealophlyctis nickersoniae]
MSPPRVVVLGGGISGLSAAWNLSKLLPKTARITLVEKSTRFGGWVNTVREDGHLFELGPRTLRPQADGGVATLDMIHQLGLEDEILLVPTSAPAAQNRFVYYQGELNPLPNNLPSLIFSNAPVTRGVLRSVLRESFVKPTTESDESIHSFFSRRLSPDVANNLVSAMIHGIYAGDAKQLSMRSCFPLVWEWEQIHGSMTKAVFNPEPVEKYEDMASPEAVEFVKAVANYSVYSFRNGMQTLTDGLVESLKAKENVDVMGGTACTGLEFGQHAVRVCLDDKQLEADHVISALPAHSLAKLLPSKAGSILQGVPTVDVGVVNLAFEGNPLPVEGFGYLVPSTENSDILGVVFDSCAMPEQDAGDKNVTRVTAMMGGHMFKEKFGSPDTVSKDHLLSVALETLREQVGIKASPIGARVTVNRQCIPQYTVGHSERLQALRDEITEQYPNLLSVTGASYSGVSVNQCIHEAQKLSQRLSHHLDDEGSSNGIVVTGLETAK